MIEQMGSQGGGGITLIFSYIRRLGFFGVFRKMNIFGGMKILWIFLESSQNWTICRGHFYAFYGLFLKTR